MTEGISQLELLIMNETENVLEPFKRATTSTMSIVSEEELDEFGLGAPSLRGNRIGLLGWE